MVVHNLSAPGRVNWLDTLPPSLARPWRTWRPRVWPLGANAQRDGAPLVLLGVLSGSRLRRDALRCTWLRVREPQVRVLFVVGRNATSGGSAADAARRDVLSVPVREGLKLAAPGAGGSRGAAMATGTLSGFMKLVHFLSHAGSQPEPIIGIADDDVFVQPRMLGWYAHALLDELGGTPFYAGAFEWYSWRTRSLVASGWARTADDALYKAQQGWRNCSAAAPDGDARGTDRCVGPFAFAKGPLVLLSAPAVRWLVRSAGFSSDPAHAMRLAAEPRAAPSPVPAGFGKVYQDVALGYWMRSHPALRLVGLRPFAAWCDSFKHVGDLDRLLMAHKPPWSHLAWLAETTERRWRRATSLRTRTACAAAPCVPPCAHARTQLACTVDAELVEPPVGPRAPRVPPGGRDGEARRRPEGCLACRCWAADAQNASRRAYSTARPPACSNSFDRSKAPRLPAHCWRRGRLPPAS